MVIASYIFRNFIAQVEQSKYLKVLFGPLFGTVFTHSQSLEVDLTYFKYFVVKGSQTI